MGTPVVDRPEGRIRPRFARLGLLGLLLITLTMVTFTTLVLIRLPDEAGFILPLLAAAVIATGLVWAFEAAWAHLVGAVLTLGLAVMTFWIAFGLLQPSSFFDFVPAVTFVLGVGLSLFGNIAAVVQQRRNHLEPRAGATERHIEQAAVGLVVVALVASGALSLLARTSVDEVEAAGAVPVEMRDFAFEPTTMETTGQAQLHVRNTDPFVHDIAVPELGIETTTVPAGSDVLVDVPAEAGTYVVYCTLHSDVTDPAPDPEEQMVGTLVVR